MKRVYYLIFLALVSTFAYSQNDKDFLKELKQKVIELRTSPIVFLHPSVLDNKNMTFIPHMGTGRFDSALAMNVKYQPIVNLRTQIEEIYQHQLDFFTGWNPVGEAHITTVTPVEYYDILRHHISIEQINKIAVENQIQQADITVQGIGCGKREIAGKIEQTFFVIVESKQLRKIRLEIYKKFIAGGGKPEAWEPDHFFPHITIGYTKRDLHESDGVIKNLLYSLDSRFNLSLSSKH